MSGPQRLQITGCVLAGGRGQRMAGADKGLADWNGSPLALHAARRLAPQVKTLIINANRHLPTYRSWGWPVVTDDSDSSADSVVGDGGSIDGCAGPAATPSTFRGPLAGMLAALQACRTPLLATVPCDVPMFPLDLVERLHAALRASGARAAVALCRQDGRLRPQPVFALLHVDLLASLRCWMQAGNASVMPWLVHESAVEVAFDRPTDDQLAFANANSAAELAELHRAVEVAASVDSAGRAAEAAGAGRAGGAGGVA